MRTKLKKTKSNRNPQLEGLSEEALRNIKSAQRVKSFTINLNKEFATIGGVPELIVSLHSAILEMQLSGNSKQGRGPERLNNLEQLRDTLITRTYGQNTFNLVENLLMV